MKYLVALFITAIAATTLVSSNAVLNKEERQACDHTSLENAAQAFSGCSSTFSSACTYDRADICVCCRNILGGSSSASGYRCCAAYRDYLNMVVACARAQGTSVPSSIRRCNLGSSAATTTISYFTGLLLLLTAVAYQFLF